MNTIDIPSQEIEFVFDNCESITVDYWAIKELNFIVDKERYGWDEHRKQLLKSTDLCEFYIKLDLSNIKHFHHTTRLIETDSISEDGKKCIERLINSDDISHIYINGTCYLLPWNANKELKQINCDLMNTNGHYLIISSSNY